MIVQNADSKKKPIALGQTYFVVQTRRQELTEEEKKFYQRSLTRKGNYLVLEHFSKIDKMVGMRLLKIVNYA